jgi:fructose-specific phosphotransferase system component IIB
MRAEARLEAMLLDLEEGRFRYSAYRNLTIGVWAGQATLEAVQRVARVSRQMLEAHPNGHSSVVFVLDGTPAPTPDARAAFATVLDARTTDLSCTAIVVEGQGFWASGIRSAITNMRIAAAGTVMLRMHDKIEELLEWLPDEHFKRTGVQFDLLELKCVLEQARQRAANADEPPERISWFAPD